MTSKRFRVNELVKYNYSEIGEYIDENHTDKPLRNDEVAELLNELYEKNQRLKDQYERKDRQLKRTKKDIQKYTDYFMNELEWDCDRILKEVFR